jgi:hypothetical protein
VRATLAAAAPGWLAAVIDASWPQVYGQRAGNLRLPEAQAAREQAIGAWLRAIPVRGRPAPASVLRAAPAGATGADGAAQADVTAALTGR